MEILEKDNLPQEVIEDETMFYETTYLLFFTNQLSAEEFDDYLKKYHKDMTFMKFVDEKLDYFDKYFNDLEGRAMKAMNSPYMRYYMKDLKRTESFQHVSQNYVKRIISYLIANIIQETCCLCFQNLFKEKYMDIFEESVEEERLKEEFDFIVSEILKPVLEGVIDEPSDKDYRRFCLYKVLHAQYIVALNTDGDIQGIKEEIHHVLSMSHDEVRKAIAKVRKKEDEIEMMAQEVFDKKITEELGDEVVEEENQIIQDKLYQIVDKALGKKTSEVDEQDFKDFLSSIDLSEKNNAKDKKVYFKLDEAYKNYFQYDENNLPEYRKAVHKLYSFFSELPNIDISKVILFCVMEMIVREENIKSLLEIEDHLGDAKYRFMDCMHLLAFFLWKKGNDEQQYNIIEAYKKIMNEIPECYQKFTEMRNDVLEEGYIDYISDVFEFSPMDTYNNHIVLSVIINIDIPAVARRVKKLVLSDYDGHYDLSVMSKQMTKYYETNKVDMSHFYIMNDFASLFIMSYMKDPTLISYTPFMRSFKDFYAMNDITLEEEVIQYLEGYENEDLKKRKAIFSIQKQFLHLLNEYHLHKDDIELNKLNEFNQVLSLMGKSFHIFCAMNDFEIVFNKYKYKLIGYIYTKNYKEFFNQPLEKQIDELICVCYIFNLIWEIDAYEEFMPKREQVQQQTYIDSLNQTIKDQQNIIDIKDQQLKDMSSKQKYPQKPMKDTKHLEEELKSYKHDIASLNKQIIHKDQEIEELKSDQEELYKLRNLIFAMQQEDESIETPSIDITHLIEDRNIVIIGGHISLRERMKQKYPSLKILAQSSHVTNDILIHADHVFMYHKFMTHDMYNRAIAILTKNHIPWDYIPYTNLEKSEEVIYHKLSRQ